MPTYMCIGQFSYCCALFPLPGQEPAAPKPLLFQRPTHDLLKGHIAEPVVPKEPPPEYEFVADPPSISAFDL